MKHYILVKYHAAVEDRQRLYQEISLLFSDAMRIAGISSVSVRPAILFSEKRYDLMIRIDCAQSALEVFDQSELHQQWKDRFARYIAHKVIFDCE